MVLVIGITGKSGAGKTHLSRILKRRGYETESADEFNRELLCDSAVIGQLQTALGKTLVNSEGEVDKAFLMRLVLSDLQSRHRIQEILHSLIFENFLEKVKNLPAQQWVFFEGALLCEEGQNEFLDASVLVECAPEVCQRRLLGGRSLPLWITRGLLEIQTPDAQKVKNVTHSFSGLSSRPQEVDQLISSLELYFEKGRKKT